MKEHSKEALRVAEDAACATQSPNSTLCGTAERVDVWLLLEDATSWSAKALSSSTLGSDVRDWLKHTVRVIEKRGHRIRPQLIKQRGSKPGSRRLMFTIGANLHALEPLSDRALVDLDLPTLVESVARRQGMATRAVTEPHYFVCTNGRRDMCCSRLGLPVYRGLRDRVGARVWQTTHVGGHRFAPNVLVVPGALMYGRVHLESLEEFVAAVESGAVDFKRLRGRTCYSPIVQAAEVMLAQQSSRLLHVDGGKREATVTFATAAGRETLNVGQAEEVELVLPGCGKGRLKPYRPFVRLP